MRTTICSLVILSLIIQMTNAAIGSSSKFRPRTNLKCESPKCPKEDDGLDLTETIKKLGVESRLIRHIELDAINAKDISKDINDATDIFATLRMAKSSTELELMA